MSAVQEMKYKQLRAKKQRLSYAERETITDEHGGATAVRVRGLSGGQKADGRCGGDCRFGVGVCFMIPIFINFAIGTVKKYAS
jgi:hypothetical protein